MALEGTIKTPLGEVSKKNAAIIGGIVVAMGVYVWYRGRQQAQASIAAAGASEIDPATGYPYGSAEDAAALAAQGNYISPGGGGVGGGGSSIPTPNTGPGTFTSNAQWSQYAQSYLTGNGQVSDAGALSAALGKYLAGQAVTANESILIHMATGIAGLPPVSGATGFPPSINTTPTPEPSPQYVNVVEGTHVDDFLAAHSDLNLTLAKLQELNPGIILRASARGYDPNGNTWVINSAGSGGKVRVS